MPNPNDYESEDDFMKVCVPKMIGEGKAQDQAVAACMNMWKDKGKAKDEEGLQASFFNFCDLSGEDAGDIKIMDGLAAGTFTAMTGDVVTFLPEELEEYLSNTLKVIESTRTEKSGEVVGLPIDKDAHDHKGGAGWIVGAELDKQRNVIRFLVNWTKEGLDLIKSNARRFFSPSAIPTTKTILGGSLTNWPATRNKQGQILLRPVELSQSSQIKEIDNMATLNELMQELETAKTQIAQLTENYAKLSEKKPDSSTTKDGEMTPEMADFIANTDGAAELGNEAREMAMRVIADAKRKNDVRDFVAKIQGGTKEKPFGVPVNAGVLAAALLSLPDEKRKFMQSLIETMWLQAIDFAERGYGPVGIAGSGKQITSEDRPLILEWMKEGRSAASWLKEVKEVDPRDYNLREFADLEKEFAEKKEV